MALGQASAATRGQAPAAPQDGQAPAAAAPGPMLLDQEDAELIPAYDASTAGNAAMRFALEAVFPPGDDADADVSLDARAPWWLWLSKGAGWRRLSLAPGIAQVRAGRCHDLPYVQVFTPDGTSCTATWERGTIPTWSRP